MGSKHAAKYDRIGQAYYDAAAMTRQEFETAIQRAQKELQGLEERRKAREIKERERGGEGRREAAKNRPTEGNRYAIVRAGGERDADGEVDSGRVLKRGLVITCRESASAPGFPAAP
ncbi:hypothetical protein HMPREF3042_01255 [Corynebacterium sp. HMSC074C05]|nr:hypothetical protein HMPREF3042_01255 [Corynebacterium sp. HMSC074C05]